VNLADKDTFADYVAHCAQPLVRTAYLLTDSWPEAEQLVEASLMQTYRHWRAVRDADPTGHTLSGVVKGYLHRRQHFADHPFGGASSPTWRAVQSLPPDERVGVVLRVFNRVPTPKIAELLDTTEHDAEEVMISAADQLRSALAREPLAGRPLEGVLAEEMDDRVAHAAIAPARFAAVAQRADRDQRRRLVPAALGLVLAVPLVVWALSALRGGDDTSAAPVTRSSGAAATSATRSPSPTEAESPSPTAPPSPSPAGPPAPKGRLTVPVLVGSRIVDLADGKASTAATLKTAEGVTVLRAGERFVLRAGAVREPAPLQLVAADGETTEIAASTGSVAVDADGRQVAYTEVDADGTAVRLVLTDLTGRREQVSSRLTETRFESLVVRGFVGDAVLLSHLEGGKELARRWNPVDNNFTVLRRRYGAIHAVHPAEKLVAMQQRSTDCGVVATIVSGVVNLRGRDCVRDLSNGVFSPDGEQIAIFEANVVTVLRVAEGLPAAGRVKVAGDVTSIAWDDEAALAVVSGGGADAAVRRCEVATGKCTEVWSPRTPDVRLIG
jgi:hypothetical protein